MLPASNSPLLFATLLANRLDAPSGTSHWLARRRGKSKKTREELTLRMEGAHIKAISFIVAINRFTGGSMGGISLTLFAIISPLAMPPFLTSFLASGASPVCI